MNNPLRMTTGVVLALVSASAFVSCERRPQTASCRVTTPSGEVHGVDFGASCAFLGIPFAAPPVGRLRWKAPQPVGAWAPAVLDATVAPPTCPLVDPPGTGKTRGSEDCLKLNVWTPNHAPSSRAPVIVWIDGEGFTAASANAAARDGQRIAAERGAIVVSANYRVGPFGFLGHIGLTAEDSAYASSANYGLLDQRAALGWVHDHIASFGGDPASVTIAGRFAGADSVGLHVVSPGSASYFSRAIMQSGFASSRWRTLVEAESVGESLATALGCADRSRVLECMRSKTTGEVLLALPSGQPQFTETFRTPWGPVVDGLEIPDQPRALYASGAFNRKPVMIGATGDEGWTIVDRAFPALLSPEVYRAEVEAEFGSSDTPAILARYPVGGFLSPKQALSTLAGDVEAVCEARRVARLIEQRGVPVFQYSYSRASHAAESGADRADHEATDDYWTRFAATGNPDAVPQASVRTSAVTRAVNQQRCDFWEPFFLRSIAGSVPAAQP